MLVEQEGEKGKIAASPSGLLPEDSYGAGEGPSTFDAQSIPQAVEPVINLPEPVPRGITDSDYDKKREAYRLKQEEIQSKLGNLQKADED